MKEYSLIENEINVPVRCKIILVGNSGVGKTSIIGGYIDKLDKNESSTIGGSYSSKEENIEGKKIIFEIWDTAGQEHFRSLNSIFFRNALICIMVYDVTRDNSLNELESYWYNSVKEVNHQEIIFHIVGNKMDLIEDEDEDNLDTYYLEEFCEKINAEYSLISSKKKQSIDNLFKKLGEKFIESNIYKKIIKEISIKNKRELNKNEEKIISLDKGKKKKKKRNFC